MGSKHSGSSLAKIAMDLGVTVVTLAAVSWCVFARDARHDCSPHDTSHDASLRDPEPQSGNSGGRPPLWADHMMHVGDEARMV